MNHPAYILHLHRTARVALLGLLLAVGGLGCASSPESRLYVFSASDSWRAVAAREAGASRFVVHFAPLNVPSYLDRPPIVTRVGDSEIKANQFHRWGIPLDVTITELLGATIARNHPEAYGDVVPHRGHLAAGYLVQVDIVRLDGYLGGPVELIAQWKVSKHNAGNEVVAQRLNRYEQTAGDPSFEAYIEAVRSVVTKMGEEISAALNERASAAP